MLNYVYLESDPGSTPKGVPDSRRIRRRMPEQKDRPATSKSHNGAGNLPVNVVGGNKSTTNIKRPSTAGGSHGRPSSSHGSSEPHATSSSSTNISRKASFTRKLMLPPNVQQPFPSSFSATYPYPTFSASLFNSFSVPKAEPSMKHGRARPPLSLSLSSLRSPERNKSGHEEFAPYPDGGEIGRSTSFDRESISSTAPYKKILASPSSRRHSRYQTPMMSPPGPGSPTLETVTYQHIQDMSSKRISTLDYLRKAHEGRVYWFNTLLFNKPDLAGMPYFDNRKLARRATNYLLLGLSLPTVIDLNSSNALEFLRSLNALLAEFETFQQLHPPDGSTSSSLSRARIPQMFKRVGNPGSKARRTSSAADIGLPMGSDAGDMKSMTGSVTSSGSASATSFPASDNDLLPGEEYTYLLTPSLPFDPDFYETFATLCDVLIDCYTRLLSLVASPRDCSPIIAEAFTKADGRVRKIIVQGVVKEFEDSSRGGVKSEVAGVGKVVLGGLM